MWRQLRILILLLILLFVALNTYFDRVYSTDWDIPLRVAIHPINADGSEAANRTIEALSPEDFTALEQFFAHEAAHYGIALERPVRFSLAPVLNDRPPSVDPRAGALPIAWWSLRTRYWVWRVADAPGPPPDIKLLVQYHDPQRSQVLPHSTGQQKGLYGIVHVFADRAMQGSNDTVIAHELLHTLGASDKYDFASNRPVHPQGYAEPDKQPLYPQDFAELMAGRIPMSQTQIDQPRSLRQVVVGAATALEIGWTRQ